MHTDSDQTVPDEGHVGIENEDDTGDPYVVEDFMAFSEEKRLNGERIDWYYWLVSMPKLTAGEAARLMSALEPRRFEDLAAGPTKGHLVDEAAENVANIQGLAERQGKLEATASEWLEWAGKSCFPVHIGYRLNLVRLAGGKAAPANGKSTQRSAPSGITKSQAVTAFGDLVTIDLAKAMEDEKNWILPARASKGARGKYPSMWNPVLLAIALNDHSKVPRAKLNHTFYTHKFLSAWLKEWKEHSEDLP